MADNIDKNKIIDLTLLEEYDKLVVENEQKIQQSIDAVANAIPLKRGEGENSLVQKTSSTATNRAISENSIAFGENTIAGCKGYYFKHIDFINKKIYLSETNTEYNSDSYGTIVTSINPLDDGWSSVQTSQDETGVSVEVRDRFSIKAGNHFILCGEIETIEPGVLTYYDKLIWNGEELTKSIFDENINAALVAASKEFDDFSISVPKKPTVGRIDLGKTAVAFGRNTIATLYARSDGYNTLAAGQCSHAEGQGTIAGYNAHSEGNSSEATGQYSHAEGYHAKSIGMAAHAEGLNTTASKQAAHAEGLNTTASERAAHAEGYLCTASGKYSHVEGTSCIASGIAAHAEGNKSEASGDYSHAGGVGTKATYIGQYAIGRYNDVDVNALFIIGNGKSDTDRSNAFKVYNSGNTVVSGALTANGGIKSRVLAGQKAGTILGSFATAEGNNTTSSGNSTHAEGSNTTASGNYSHAEGNRATASGVASHAEGSNTKALGNFSHAAGEYTIAKASHQTVIGKYNSDSLDALFIVGNGVSDTVRSNAFEVISDTNKNVSIKIGSTALTETRLKQLISGKNSVNASYALQSEIQLLQSEVQNKFDKLSYDPAGAADVALEEAKAYTDEASLSVQTFAQNVANNAANAVKNELEGKIATKTDSATVDALNQSLTNEIARAKAAEEQNAKAIERLTNGVSASEIDGVNDLIEYVNTHGPEVKGIKEDINNLTENKVDKSSLNNYYTKTEANNTFVSYNDINDLPSHDLIKEVCTTRVPTLEEKVTNLENNKADKSELTNYAKTTDLNAYALKTDIPVPIDAYTKEESDETFAKIEDVQTNYVSNETFNTALSQKVSIDKMATLFNQFLSTPSRGEVGKLFLLKAEAYEGGYRWVPVEYLGDANTGGTVDNKNFIIYELIETDSSAYWGEYASYTTSYGTWGEAFDEGDISYETYHITEDTYIIGTTYYDYDAQERKFAPYSMNSETLSPVYPDTPIADGDEYYILKNAI